VATKSGDCERVTIVQDLLNKIRQHSNELVSEALLVSDELIRVSALWHEVWYTGFQEASRLLFELKDPVGMMRVFDLLHRNNLECPETPRELGFVQAFRSELERAREWITLYKKTKSMRDMNAGWSVYLKVFYRIQRMLPKLSALDLNCVSPKLCAAKNMRLVIPGTYNVNSENVRIAAFHPKLSVIQSKQRPRKVQFIGENGQVSGVVVVVVVVVVVDVVVENGL
jgi:FKBP12-rapamycin complex-associated protein